MSPLVPPGVRAVFFDAVGTLITPNPPAPVVYAEAAARHGVAVSPVVVRERFVAAYHREEEIDRDRGWVTSEEREEERWRRIVAAALPAAADPDACFHELYHHFAQPDAWAVDPDAAVVFDELARRGVLVGVGSNYDRRLDAVVAGHPALARLRPRVVISSVVGWRKPAGEFFTAVLAAAGGLRPAEVLFVGDDRGNDYDGAAAAGLPAVLLDPRGRHPDVPRRIASLRELV